MQQTETRAAISISTLFSLRMLGLFMVLPVFTPYAHHLQGATPFLAGAALGIYGLTQALFQLPLGALSDYYPRKMIIAAGFLVFILGSLICAYTHSITGMMTGRALQGMGAVGSTLTALLTDLVRPEKRSKSMAILGIMIAFAFFISMILGPVLNPHIGVRGIFIVTALLGILAVILLFSSVPRAPVNIAPVFSFKNMTATLRDLLSHPQLLILDMGIFCLHTILTASFVVIPLWVTHWTVYILPLLISFIFTFGLIGFAEKSKKVFILYFWSIGGLLFAELFLGYFQTKSAVLFSTGLTLFFLAFNLLEANLPSLVSRLVPVETKGTAMGIYSTFQFSGIFCGGILGGVIDQYSSSGAVLLSCGLVSLIWLSLTLIIRFLRRASWQEV